MAGRPRSVNQNISSLCTNRFDSPLLSSSRNTNSIRLSNTSLSAARITQRLSFLSFSPGHGQQMHELGRMCRASQAERPTILFHRSGILIVFSGEVHLAAEDCWDILFYRLLSHRVGRPSRFFGDRDVGGTGRQKTFSIHFPVIIQTTTTHANFKIDLSLYLKPTCQPTI